MSVYRLDDASFDFPSPEEADDEYDGLLAVGGDYNPERMLDGGGNGGNQSSALQWDEGYRYWWDLTNIQRLSEPIPCRGNVGMWYLPESLVAKVSAAVGGV